MNDAGHYSGLGIFLWHHIAEELGFEYSIEQYRFKVMLEDVRVYFFYYGVNLSY